MIDAFLGRFPLWPRALAEKFQSVLPYAMQDSAEYDQAKTFYDSSTNKAYTSTIRVLNYLPYNYQFGISLLQPSNDRYIRRNNAQMPVMQYPINAMSAEGFALDLDRALGMGYLQPYVHTTYDARIFSNIKSSVNVKFVKTVGPIHFSYLSIMSYASALVNYGESYLVASAQPEILPFLGLSSIIALHENGVTLPGVDINEIYDFATYVNAYNNYSGELQAEQNLLTQKANIAVNDYRQQLDDQAAREYADLQAKKIQLLIAIDNDAKSAQRDFQNMLLTAQGLKNQIGGNLV